MKEPLFFLQKEKPFTGKENEEWQIEDVDDIIQNDNSEEVLKENEEVLKENDNSEIVLKENDNSEEELKENDNSEIVLKENDNSEEVLKENEEVLKENEEVLKEEIKQDGDKKLKYNNSIIIFDLDGTLCHSGQQVENKMIEILKKIKNKYNCDFAVNGGGTYEKICSQIGELKTLMKYIFAECGSVVYEIKNNSHDVLIKKNSLIHHKSYNIIQKLIRHSLKFISETSYELNGHLIDVRNGLVYISLVGMQANLDQRELFLKMDKRMEFRKRLMIQLNERKEKLMFNQPTNLDITITYGGQVGISIFPSDWDKVQCLKYLEKYENINFFGDRYDINGNDYKMMNHPKVNGHRINNHEETYEELLKILNY